MSDTTVRLKPASDGSADRLEVVAPLSPGTGVQIWGTLSTLGVQPRTCSFTRDRGDLVAEIQVSEPDGSRLSEERVGQLLGALSTRLSGDSPGSAGVLARVRGRLPRLSALRLVPGLGDA